MIRTPVVRIAVLTVLSSAWMVPALAGGNPCAAKNPCAAAAASIDPALVTRPKGTKPFAGRRADLVAEGERLWKSTALGTNGMACETCHQNGGAFNASFAKPYPHAVSMPGERAGLQRVSAEQMVQFCMIAPMAAKPLAWDSRELAALTAYTGEVQKAFIKGAARNPCASKNPCAAK